MKIGSIGVTMVGARFRINAVVLCGVANPYRSLAWTALRIPNCRPLRGNTQSRLIFLLMSSEASLGGSAMQAIYPCVAGLDVHKQTVVACVRRLDARGKVSSQVRTFSTMTRDLLHLADWLVSQGATRVAMESTGV